VRFVGLFAGLMQIASTALPARESAERVGKRDELGLV